MACTDGNDATKNQTCTYAADDLSRLASASCGGAWAQTFTYDPFGNIAKGGSGSYTAAYNNVTNQVSSGISPLPTYDANGNALKSTGLSSLTWNAAGQPATVTALTGGAIAGTYDALGRLVETLQGSTYTEFVFSPAGGKLAVVQGPVNAGVLIKATIPLPGGETAVYNASGLEFIRHTDWLGSSRLTTTWAHAVYSKEAYAPFGETYNEAGTPDRSFTGQDQDTTPAVYDYLFRKYDPVAGRWLSPDPAGWSAVDLSNPQSLNRYAYVQNNPMASVDPKGLDDCYPVTDGTDSPTGETVCVPTFDASNNTPPYGANYLNENPTVYDQEDELDALEAMGLMAQLNSGDPAAAAQALQIMEDNGWIWPPIDTTGGDSGDNSGSDSCGTPSNSSSSDANFTAALKRSGFRAMDGTSTSGTTSGTNSCKAPNNDPDQARINALAKGVSTDSGLYVMTEKQRSKTCKTLTAGAMINGAIATVFPPAAIPGLVEGLGTLYYCNF
jgi:RHS repeat-associated protein